MPIFVDEGIHRGYSAQHGGKSICSLTRMRFALNIELSFGAESLIAGGLRVDPRMDVFMCVRSAYLC